MNNKGATFLFFLGVSLAVHAAGLIALAFPQHRLSPPPPVKPIEVAYQQSAPSSPPKTIVTARVETSFARKPLPQPPLLEKNTNLLKDAGRRDFAKEEALRAREEQKTPVMEHKMVTLPNIPGEVFKTPEYKDYYHTVREKIRRLAYAHYKRPEMGEVFLTFALDADGTLQTCVINTQRSTANPYLSEIASMSVRDAAPFPPFPEKLKNNKTLVFNVIISFELK